MKANRVWLIFLILSMFYLVACAGYTQTETVEATNLTGIPIKNSEKYYETQASLSDESEAFRNYYETCISTEEYQVVETALAEAPTEKLRNAQSYLIVLLRAIQDTAHAEIQIVSAEVIPYPLPEKSVEPDTPFRDAIISMEAEWGCDEYAVQIIDAEGNDYIIWDSYVYEKVFCNGTLIRSYYHIIF